MAPAVSVMADIWVTSPEKLLCKVSSVPRIDSTVAIMAGNCAFICGSSATVRSMSVPSVVMSELNVSTLSIALKTDLVAAQTGMSVQCCSQ